jgi:septum site-determining protein MinC
MDDLAAAIRIKGMHDGLLVSLPAGEWDDQSAALLAQIDDQQSFFSGARLALDVGSQSLRVNEMVRLRDSLSERNVALWAVLSESEATEKTAQLLGLATRISKPRPEEQQSLEVGPISDETALYVNRTIRSGTRVEFPGSVVVLGDINPGAELVVQGSVIIWGHLRGAVHAGSAGDSEAVVCALELGAVRLQIADRLLDGSENPAQPGPAKASIRDGGIVVESWESAAAG